MREPAVCKVCGEVAPYRWLAGYHHSEDGISLRGELWPSFIDTVIRRENAALNGGMPAHSIYLER